MIFDFYFSLTMILVWFWIILSYYNLLKGYIDEFPQRRIMYQWIKRGRTLLHTIKEENEKYEEERKIETILLKILKMRIQLEKRIKKNTKRCMRHSAIFIPLGVCMITWYIYKLHNLLLTCQN